MSDQSDSTLEILIKLGVIGQSDVKAAQDLLKQTAATSAGSAEAGRDMGQKLEEAGEKGTHAAHGLFDSHREVHRLLHTIGNDAVPGMGAALGALAHGPLGAIIAVGMAVEFVKKSIEATNKQLDEMSANASKAFGGGDWLTGYVNAAAQAATETENLAAALHKASDVGPEIKNRYDGEAKAIKNIVEAIKAKLKAQEESDLADARAAAKKSGASPEVAAATEAMIRARYESQTNAASDAADQALQQARARELAERKKNQPTLTSVAESKTTPIEVIQSRTSRDAELKAQEAALAKATSEMNTEANDNLKEEIESKKKALEFGKKAHGDSDPLGLVKNMQDELDRQESETAEARAEAAKKKIEQLGKQAAKDAENAVKEKSALDEATAAATENATRIVQLNKEIAEANTAAKIKALPLSKLVSSLAPYEDSKTLEKTAGVDTDAGAAALIQKFLAAQSRLGKHRGTADDSQMVGLMNQLFQTTREADGRTFLLLKDLIEHKGNLSQSLAELAHQVSSQPVMRGSVTGQ